MRKAQSEKSAVDIDSARPANRMQGVADLEGPRQSAAHLGTTD
jgi:hypothetical protein